jgi:hypothetical protein
VAWTDYRLSERFEAIDQRFEAVTRCFDRIGGGLLVGLTGVIVAVILQGG